MISLLIGIILLMLPYACGADDFDTLIKQIERHKEKSVEIELDIGIGQVYLFKGMKDLVADVRVMYDRDEYQASLVYEEIDPKHGKLSLTSRQRKDTILRHFDLNVTQENVWRVELNPKIAYTIKGDLGAIKGELDFTGLKIDGLDLDMGASTLSILFNAKNKGHIRRMRIGAGASKLRLEGLGNAHFDRLDLNGGVGQFTLDFSGSLDHHAEVELSMSFGSTTILIPREIGAYIEASDGILSSVLVDEDFNEDHRGEYTNESYGHTKGEIQIDIDATFGSITIESIENEN